jgi:hypothetical protein
VIQMPRRSVTRFFIPLIDVLILLFCIFLLMPFVSGPVDEPAEGGPTAPAPGAEPPPPPTAANIQQMARDLDRARRRIEELEKQQEELFRNLTVVLLEIDKDTGELYTFPPNRAKIADEQLAKTYIDRMRREARDQRQGRAGEVFFLILLPRELTGFPQARQVEEYERWFHDVPHGFDSPRRAG